MKYVIARNRVTDRYSISVFDESTIHSYVAQGMKRSDPAIDILSAGFVHLPPGKDGKWVVAPDKSLSLNLVPFLGAETLLNLFLVEGLTGLDLLNMLAYLSLTSTKIV